MFIDIVLWSNAFSAACSIGYGQLEQLTDMLLDPLFPFPQSHPPSLHSDTGFTDHYITLYICLYNCNYHLQEVL